VASLDTALRCYQR